MKTNCYTLVAGRLNFPIFPTVSERRSTMETKQAVGQRVTLVFVGLSTPDSVQSFFAKTANSRE